MSTARSADREDCAETKALVDGVRGASRALGSGLKAPTPSELPNLPLIRKSLVAARDLPAGAQLTLDISHQKIETIEVFPHLAADLLADAAGIFSSQGNAGRNCIRICWVPE